MSDESEAAGITAGDIHPSTFIIEEMEERGWDRDQLATHMAGQSDKSHWGVTRLALDFYLDMGPTEPNMRIGDTAHEFARAFGTSPEFWTNLETAWLAKLGHPHTVPQGADR